MGFRCAACDRSDLGRRCDFACSRCEKIFGRTDAVVTEMVDKATEVSTQMLRLALHELFNAG
jgi:hypothetical protein